VRSTLRIRLWKGSRKCPEDNAPWLKDSSQKNHGMSSTVL